jgi:hypothetical protein
MMMVNAPAVNGARRWAGPAPTQHAEFEPETLAPWERVQSRTPSGILIIDDFGHWAGAKHAVEQYFDEIGLAPFLHRIDQMGCLVIKPGHAPAAAPCEGT